ncbi:hypothetical protein HMPREF9069_01241 [Atopobium sp. oral taxon 810 str. F0209]|nr:hypothetical protein HMPREF9069_01241 [Atopobium sp. oral taxon 810 str. F0209]
MDAIKSLLQLAKLYILTKGVRCVSDGFSVDDAGRRLYYG